MEGHRSRGWLLIRPGIAAALVSALGLGTSTPAGAQAPADLPECGTMTVAAPADGRIVSPWDAELDADGSVVGHRMTLRFDGSDTQLRTGRRGFSALIEPGLAVVGERSTSGTQLDMIDTRRACRRWSRHLDELVYDIVAGGDDSGVRLELHDPASRRFLGTLLLDPETGLSNALIDGECTTSCQPNDGAVPAAAMGPAGEPQPVPPFPAGGWTPGKTLPFRWGTSAVPPTWARGPVKSAALDVARSSRSRSPVFEFHSGALDSVRYTSHFPTFCRLGIACASRAMPDWAVWIRPQGTDFSWGTLRWCQRDGRTSGCFDLRRVTLHELGHVTGLNHPSSAGFRLAAHETVMHAITPARPGAGSAKHAFGRCDVATLQELYDVPTRRAAVSTCNQVATRLTLRPSRSVIEPGAEVALIAELRVADRVDYGRLRGNALNSRALKLKYRRAGSSDAWSAVWMQPRLAGRYRVRLAPSASWEFRAVFPSPPDEGLRYSRSDVVKVRVRR